MEKTIETASGFGLRILGVGLAKMEESPTDTQVDSEMETRASSP